MIMTMPLASIRLFVGVAAILMVIGAAIPSAAQQRNSDGSPNPTASVLDEQTLLQQPPRIEGRIDIPYPRERVLIQPAGRIWDYFHEVILHWFGAIVIIGMLAALAIAYVTMGPIRMSAGRSGIKIPRFNGFERFSHWLTAVSFVVLGLTGLNITFGKIVLLPLIGSDNFSAFAQAAKYVHNFVSFSFVVGLVLIIAMWIKDNFARKVDVAQGGWRLHQGEASAGGALQCRGKAGVLVCAGGAAVIVSGYLLIFPFYSTDILGMQIAQVVHAVVALLFVALILAHIYIGTIGMEGAFEAMGEGTVDRNWAKEHHSLWLEEQLASAGANESGGHPAATPAEYSS
jgi:formate dehydrogenase subunit gamma